MGRAVRSRSCRAARTGSEAAHSVRRVLHAGDATGREIDRALWERVVKLPSVEIVNHGLVTDLVVEQGVVRGVRYFDSETSRHEVPRARDAARDRRRRAGLPRKPRIPRSRPVTASRSPIMPGRA